MSEEKSRRNLLLSALAFPAALTALLFSKKAYGQNPADTGLLTKIQAEVALIYAWLEERVKVWNDYIEKVNNGLSLVDNIKKSGEFITNYTRILKDQLEQLTGYARSFESGGQSILSMRFRKFNLEAQAIVVYCTSLKRKALTLLSEYDRQIEREVKDKQTADKIKETSGKRAAVEISSKAYDSIATARMAAVKLKADMKEAEEKTLTLKDPRVKAEVFEAATLRSRGELEAAKLEQQALTNELLASILQTLTQGQPISTSKSREVYGLETIYDYMQGKGSLTPSQGKAGK
jgi:hypothetical protein